MSAYAFPAFSPLDVANLQAWYDASDAATITDAGSGAVSAWADKSGNGFTATEATNRPTTGTRTQNGLNVIDFDGSNDMLASSCPTDDNTSSTFVVACVDNVTGQARTLYGSNGNAGESLRANATTGSLQFESQAVAAILNSLIVPGNGNPFVVGLVLKNGSYISIFTHDDRAATPSLGFGPTAGRTMQIGASNAAAFLDGWIGEIVRYSDALALDDVAAVMGYLSAKWGLTLS